MARKKMAPPTILHATRFAVGSREQVASAFVKEYLGRAPFRYACLDDVARLALAKRSQAELDSIITSKRHLDRYQSIFLEVTPLIRTEFAGRQSKYVLDQPRAFTYPINEIHLRFKPPFVFSDGARIIVPTLLYWKKNDLTDKQIALYFTLVREILLQDPDYADSEHLLFDFSVPAADEGRSTRVIEESQVGMLGAAERDSMLTELVAGFEMAKQVVAALPERTKAPRTESPQKNLPGI